MGVEFQQVLTSRMILLTCKAKSISRVKLPTLFCRNVCTKEKKFYNACPQIGPVKGCKIIREPGGGDPYAFVEFTNHQVRVLDQDNHVGSR
jgi:RNA recognition motif. (a.k.a. RRM, RBD, or RNP domain)